MNRQFQAPLMEIQCQMQVFKAKPIVQLKNYHSIRVPDIPLTALLSALIVFALIAILIPDGKDTKSNHKRSRSGFLKSLLAEQTYRFAPVVYPNSLSRN